MSLSPENSTIRLSPQSEAALRELARREGKPIQAVLDEAIEHYQREKFMEEANAAYSRLQSDPEAWKEELDERRAWDATLKDGLDNE